MHHAVIYEPHPSDAADDHDLHNLVAPLTLSPHTHAYNFEEDGHAILVHFIEKAIRSWPAWLRECFRDWVQINKKKNLGTLCSGTDSPVLIRNGWGFGIVFLSWVSMTFAESCILSVNSESGNRSIFNLSGGLVTRAKP